MTPAVPLLADESVVEADAATLYAEICVQEGLETPWSEAPSWCRGVFLAVARNPYGVAENWGGLNSSVRLARRTR